MIYQAFSIYDTAAITYSPPFYFATKGLAIRMFSETAADTNTSIGRHPMDFTLFHIGEFDDSNGQMIPEITPTPIIKASETKPPTEEL